MLRAYPLHLLCPSLGIRDRTRKSFNECGESVEHGAHDGVGQKSAAVGEHQPLGVDPSAGRRRWRFARGRALDRSARRRAARVAAAVRSITSSVCVARASSCSKSATGSRPSARRLRICVGMLDIPPSRRRRRSRAPPARRPTTRRRPSSPCCACTRRRACSSWRPRTSRSRPPASRSSSQLVAMGKHIVVGRRQSRRGAPGAPSRCPPRRSARRRRCDQRPPRRRRRRPPKVVVGLPRRAVDEVDVDVLEPRRKCLAGRRRAPAPANAPGPAWPARAGRPTACPARSA